MGVYYKYIFIDEMDWSYVRYSRKDFVDSVLKSTEDMDLYCEHISDFSTMAIFDMGKIGDYNNDVEKLLKLIGPFDRIYYQRDSDIVLNILDIDYLNNGKWK
jgi:hypothetical protein